MVLYHLLKKCGCYIVPFGINGKLQPFKRQVVVNFGRPYKVIGDLDDENEILKQKIIDLIKKGRDDNEKIKK